MTILMSKTPHVQGLICHLRTMHKDRKFSNIKVMCTDGCCMSSGLILAAISPLVAMIGQTLRVDEEPMIVLPDITMMQFEFFIQDILSESGPLKSESHMFQEMLQVFNSKYQASRGVKFEISQEIEESRLRKCFKDDTVDYFSEWDESFSGDESEVYEPKPKRKFRSSTNGKGKKRRAITKIAKNENEKQRIREMVKGCFYEDKNAYVCTKCGTERSGARSMQVKFEIDTLTKSFFNYTISLKNSNITCGITGIPMKITLPVIYANSVEKFVQITMQ